MNRVEWQQIAERWLIDAKRLLDDHRWPVAYYLAGYAVECGLKACILARLGASPEVIFEDKRFSEKCWSHSVLELVKLADLETVRAADAALNPDLYNNWVLVKDWSEKVRYQSSSRQLAEKLYMPQSRTILME